MPVLSDSLSAVFSVLLAVCTTLYFCAFLWTPKRFNTVFSTDHSWKLAADLFRYCVIAGVSALMLLGFKEVWYMVAGVRLGIAYDDYIGISGLVIAFLSLKAFERAGKRLAANQE